jgi:hypothetical protein
MNRGDIDLIRALGPQQMQAVIGNAGKLKEVLVDRFQLLNSAERTATYKLEYNPGADLSKKAVAHLLNAVKKTSFFSNLPPNAVQLHWSISEKGSSVSVDSVSSSFAGDPFIRSFYTVLAKKLGEQGITFKMEQTRVVNRNIALHTRRMIAPHEGFASDSSNDTLAILNVKIWALAEKNIDNLSFNKFSWWIDLRNVTVASTE